MIVQCGLYTLVDKSHDQKFLDSILGFKLLWNVSATDDVDDCYALIIVCSRQCYSLLLVDTLLIPTSYIAKGRPSLISLLFAMEAKNDHEIDGTAESKKKR